MTAVDSASKLTTKTTTEIDIEQGFWIIKKGKCIVQNKHNTVTTLMSGYIFGESQLFKTKGYDCFGDIIADSKETKLWFITYKDIKKLPQYDYVKLKENCLKGYTQVCHLLIKHN